MKIIKFEGTSMRDALAKVKAELGDQAVIVSSRQIKKGLLGQGYEIAAAIEDDRVESPRFTASGGLATSRPLEPARAAIDDGTVERLVGPLRAELRSLRAMIRSRAEEKPGKLEQEMAALRRAIEELQRVPAEAPPAPPPIALPSTAAVVMLVGPTGVGKTTTIAKIAAHAALVENARVAVVTLDNYRVGGVEQIRTFADLIGVPLHVVESPADLGERLDQLAGYDLVLVDTAGTSPRDREALAALTEAVTQLPRVEVHLTIAAGSSPEQIDELHRRFEPLRPRRLLFTKVDECGYPLELARAPARLGLPVAWVATGQAVPEDLELMTVERLVALSRDGLPGTRRAA